MADKDLKKLVRAARKQGWTVEQTKNGHWRFKAPDGIGLVHASGTASDHRSMANLLAQLKRYGFDRRSQ
jgi:hypothetical protein